jgi:hypothetical protein
MPKKTIIYIMLLFPLLIGLACRFTSRADPTATPTEEPAVVVETEAVPEVAAPTKVTSQEEPAQDPSPRPVQETKDLVILDQSAWIQDGDLVFVGYLIENPSNDIFYEGVEFTIRILSPDGSLIDTSYISGLSFFPSTTRGLAALFYLADANFVVDSADISWTFTGTSTASDATDPLTADNLVVWDNGGYPIVTGKVFNSTAVTYTDIRIDILCYDQADEIVGGGIAYLDFIHLNDYMGFTAYVDTFEDVERVEAFPSFSLSTSVIDKTDFKSEISVVADSFYTDQFGYLNGGIIIQNETDAVIEASLVYITFYDKDDHVTSTGSKYIDKLLPGDTLGLAPWISSPPEEAVTERYDILFLPGDLNENYELDSNPFRVNSTSVTGDFDNYVLVNFTNTYSKQVSEVDVYVLVFDEQGDIIGGGNTWTMEPTSAGGTGEIEVWVSYGSNSTIADIQAWVVPSYFTRFE